MTQPPHRCTMNSKCFGRLCVALVACSLLGSTACETTYAIVGRVVNEQDQPIESAAIRRVDIVDVLYVRSREDGCFVNGWTTSVLDSGRATFRVEVNGFQPVDFKFDSEGTAYYRIVLAADGLDHTSSVAAVPAGELSFCELPD